MTRNRTRYFLPILCISLLLILCACAERSNVISGQSNTSDQQDSLIQALIDENPDRALTLVDSLTQLHQIPEAKADFFRGQTHYRLGQELTAELYYKRSLTDDALYQENPPTYYYVIDQLSTILTRKGDQDGALTISTKGYAIVKNDTTQTGRFWTAIILHDIGYSQMQLGHKEQAEKSFMEAWNSLKGLVNESPTFDHLHMWSRITYNIIDAYTSTEQFKEADTWLQQGDEAIGRMTASPDCPTATAEEYIAGLNTHKALVYLKTGRRAEAEKAYQRFLGTTYSKTGSGTIEHCEYLELAGRWKEMADLTPKVDSIVQSWGTPPSLYYLKSYLTPYLKAYIYSGRHHEALQMSERLVNLTDSIYNYERQHNAAELAIMYETQEKEKQIAEQQTMLKNQRYFAVLIAILIMLISFVIITLLRLRNAKRLSEKNQELEEKNRELTIANERAEESSRMKTDFIQQISHEIRTPLNILSGFTQVLTAPKVELTDEERKDINTRINTNTTRITELVNKMLELSYIHSKTVIERTDEVTTVQIAAQATENSDISHATHLIYKLEFDPAADKMIRTNAESAARALTLLLNNAAKFTKEGGAELRITLDETRKMVVYTVTDTGIGIPPEEAEHIFEEFLQLDNYYDGTGIGLSVARSIAHRLGGDIYLDTTYQGGARFVFTLPDEA
ncbi:MAG: HAMP domain-containing histidine kinase [Prevotella sp.]|nr:HAMP domain-containing histidine kinase [Prevotella sp.]